MLKYKAPAEKMNFIKIKSPLAIRLLPIIVTILAWQKSQVLVDAFLLVDHVNADLLAGKKRSRILIIFFQDAAGSLAKKIIKTAACPWRFLVRQSTFVVVVK